MRREVDTGKAGEKKYRYQQIIVVLIKYHSSGSGG
jgi:hypothetical protein